jgi:MATE family multidrug resistance protein
MKNLSPSLEDYLEEIYRLSISAGTIRVTDFGTEVLAANAVLFQIQYILAYFFDGFANASSVWAGKSQGKKDMEMYQTTVSLSWWWSFYGAIGLAGVYWLGKSFLSVSSTTFR